MKTIIIVMAIGLLLAACAGPNGELPRLAAPSAQTSGPAGFGGGYAGANAGSGDFNKTTVPF